VKLTSRVLSTLKNIGGTFVTIEDGVLSSAKQNRTFAAFDHSEIAEEAGISERRSEKTDTSGIESVPVIKLNTADVMPVQVVLCTSDSSSDKNVIQGGVRQLSSSFVDVQCSADTALQSLSEYGDQTTKEPNEDDDGSIVFSSGKRRKAQRSKQSKGRKTLLRLAALE